MAESCLSRAMAGRSGRMFADYYASLIAQLGGEQVISEARRMLCRRASLFEVELNIIEGELAKLRGQGNMKMLARKTALEWLAQYTTMVNSQRRVLEAVGLNRVAREVPTLSQLHCRNREQEGRGGGCLWMALSRQGQGRANLLPPQNARCRGGGMSFTIEDALTDPQLLGAGLGPIASWSAWLAVLKGAYGLPLRDDELATFQAVTGNRTPPSKRVDELWNVVGRRGGKSKIAAALAVFEACCIDHSCQAIPRRDGHVLVLASTVQQAKVVFGYIKGYVEASPLFMQLVDSVLAHEIRLKNHIVISVHPSSFRSVRGRTLLCAILDEVSFWRDDASANPDVETYRAILPSLATTNGMLVGISTPYRKIGLLHTKWRDHFAVDDDAVLVTQGASLRVQPDAEQAGDRGPQQG